VKGSSLASRPDSLICPLCEADRLKSSGHGSMRCQSCRAHLSGTMLETLQQITTLPDALGAHACECGHPQMRRLPDGVFHCPACGSEVVPLEASGRSRCKDSARTAARAGFSAVER
jgi:ribosomal protein L37AE/L43A